MISMELERVDSSSLEHVRFPVFADSGGAPINPTSYPVKMAFLADGGTKPTSGDWKPGGWDTTVIGTYVATIPIGPGGAATLAAGTWYAWVQIATGTETIVRQVGELVID